MRWRGLLVAKQQQHLHTSDMAKYEAAKRIDYGIKRPKRGSPDRPKPSDLERQARDEAGKFLTIYTPELKQQAIAAAIQALEVGARVEEVADRMQVPRSTMYSWLMGEQAKNARTQFFDAQLMQGIGEIRASGAPLDLARARELFSAWFKVAQVRDAANYGPKQELTVNVVPVLNIVTKTPEAIDVTPTPVTDDAK